MNFPVALSGEELFFFFVFIDVLFQADISDISGISNYSNVKNLNNLK